MAKRSQMIMLFEEMLLSSVRSGRLGQVPEVEIGSGVDPDGNPIIWFKENGLHLSARKQMMSRRFADLVEPEADTARDEHMQVAAADAVQRATGAANDECRQRRRRRRAAALGGGARRGADQCCAAVPCAAAA